MEWNAGQVAVIPPVGLCVLPPEGKHLVYQPEVRQEGAIEGFIAWGTGHVIVYVCVYACVCVCVCDYITGLVSYLAHTQV